MNKNDRHQQLISKLYLNGVKSYIIVREDDIIIFEIKKGNCGQVQTVCVII